MRFRSAGESTTKFKKFANSCVEGSSTGGPPLPRFSQALSSKAGGALCAMFAECDLRTVADRRFFKLLVESYVDEAEGKWPSIVGWGSKREQTGTA